MVAPLIAGLIYLVPGHIDEISMTQWQSMYKVTRVTTSQRAKVELKVGPLKVDWEEEINRAT